MSRVQGSRTIWMVLGALAALTALGVGSWFAFRGPNEAHASAAKENPKLGTVTAAQPAPRGLGEQVGAARLFALEQRIQALEAEDKTRPQAKEPEPSAPPREVGETAEPLPSPAELKATNERKIAAVAEAFKAEPTDPQWSRETENVLDQAFKKRAFAGSSVLRTECASSFCTMLIRHETYADRSEFERFMSDAPGMGGEFVFRDSPEGKPETVAYFIRPGHDTPEHAVRQSY